MRQVFVAALFALLLHGVKPVQAQDLCALAASAGTPQIEGLSIVWLSPLGDPAQAQHWKHIIIHQMEGPPGAAKGAALAQAKKPTRRGTTLWVETDGTVYWSVPETAIPTHGDGANRKDNKLIPNFTTYRRVVKDNSLGIEFSGNFPDVRKPATPAQHDALMKLLPFLQERYRISPAQIYAHNWIDHKDARYCEGCGLAEAARRLDYRPRCGSAKRSKNEKATKKTDRIFRSEIFDEFLAKDGLRLQRQRPPRSRMSLPTRSGSRCKCRA